MSMIYWKKRPDDAAARAAAPPEPAALDYTPEPVAARPVRRGGRRSYEAARHNRLTADWQAWGSSADSEIVQSLGTLRSRSMAMIRDNPYAKNGVRLIVDNVIGSGIGMQAQISTAAGDLVKRQNDKIEEEYKRWCRAKYCHTGGVLHFHALERVIMRSIVSKGEAIIRKHREPFGNSGIPYALELIPPERLIDQWQIATNPENGNEIRLGVEVDRYGRPVAYWLWPRHPGDFQFLNFSATNFERVPAADIIHLYVVEDWPQTRGVPWYHASLMRLRHSGEYESSELIAARASANIVGFVETPDDAMPGDGEEDRQRILETEPGTFQTLYAGEVFKGFNPSRPNSALEPFMRYLLRSVAVGLGPCYSAFSGDYSQHNYSSLRKEALDERDFYRPIQVWLARDFRQEVHEDFCDALALSGRISAPDYYTRPEKYQAVRFKPRGWTWIDVREIPAMIKAVRAGFTTVSDVIGETAGGADAEEIFTARRRELDYMAALRLVFDTDPAFVDGQGEEQPDAQEPDDDADDGAAAKKPGAENA